MAIDYKKLIPSSLRTTRWGQYLEAFQSVMSTIKTNKVDIIENQYEIEKATNAQIIMMKDTLGYNFLTFDVAYPSSNQYLQREILTVTQRILNRTCKKAYDYNFYIYELNGTIYPMTYDGTTSILSPVTNWWTFNELEYNVVDRLDLGDDRILYYDSLGNPIYASPKNFGFSAQTLDTSAFPHLDMKTIHDTLTRHILISYAPRYIDNTADNEFFSTETLLAFYEDILYTKRATEIPYFEPICQVNCSGVAVTGVKSNPASGTVNSTKENYYSYDGTHSGLVTSFYFGGNVAETIGLSGIASVQFGTGGYNPITYDITKVQTPIILSGIVSGLVSISDLDFITGKSPTRFNVRKKITQKCKFTDYNEIALLDQSGVVFYATFPQMTYLTDKKKFYSNASLDIILV